MTALIVVAACSVSMPSATEPDPTAVATLNPTATPVPASTTGPVPTPTVDPATGATPTAITIPPTVTPVPTPQPDGPCGVGPLALPDPNRPVYDVALDIDPASRTVEGTMTVDFGPDLPVDELVFRLWPNGPRPTAGGVDLQLTRVELPTGPVEPELLLPTLALVPLPQTLQPGERITAQVDFTLTVPTELRSRLSGRDDYMRLGTIIPLLPWEPGIGWASDPATSLFAEAVLSPVADWTVAIDVPDDFDVLASGVRDDDGVWRVESARDFAISVGRFRTVTATAFAPEPVQVIVGVHETIDDDEQAYLDKVVDSLEQFSARFGQYPWPSLTFALTPNLRGGIEFPTHIMQGQNTIGRTTSHEVGHMFFYSLVGNNQGAHPWLDEGITSYAEFTYEGTAPGAYAIAANGIGEAAQPMTFWESRPDAYYSSVYSQTGFALQLLGDRDDVDCALARFVADNAHAIARPMDFVQAFEPTFPGIVDDLAQLGVNLN